MGFTSANFHQHECGYMGRFLLKTIFVFPVRIRAFAKASVAQEVERKTLTHTDPHFRIYISRLQGKFLLNTSRLKS